MPVYSRDSALRGKGSVSAEAITAWFNERGRQMAPQFSPDKKFHPVDANFGQIVIAECSRYPDHVLNWDLVASQISHETASGQSRYFIERRNVGGIGAVNADPDQALWFETVEAGVRAHVAHLANYVFGKGEWSQYDPRGLPDNYYGIAPDLKSLEQRWAWSPPARYNATPPEQRYGGRIAALANQLVTFANDQGWGPPMAAQIPGFTWYPADADHYTPGRTTTIKGYAQHYTGGTDSRGWLTTSPNSDVSATFLIKHNPTMADRGWQLVRIEDTPHTTGSIVNPFTVSCEYEQLDGQPIPDIAYDVMAQTILDAATYVTLNQLGEIPINRTWIKGHKEWVGDNRVCPDGISVDRIVKNAVTRLGIEPSPPNEWYLHLGGGLMAKYPFVLGFRSHVMAQALTRFPTDPNSAALAMFGEPKEHEWQGVDGHTYQRCKRLTLHYTPGNAAPWDVIHEPSGAKLPERRQP